MVSPHGRQDVQLKQKLFAGQPSLPSGSQISFARGGWKYVTAAGVVVSGFIVTNHLYDGNLRYFPPPGFPVGNVYDLISWEELQ